MSGCRRAIIRERQLYIGMALAAECVALDVDATPRICPLESHHIVGLLVR